MCIHADPTPVKSRTSDPVWAPPELFEFYPVTEEDIVNSRLIVSVFHRELIGKDDLVGDGIVKLSSVNEREAFSSHRVPLVDKMGDPIDSCHVSLDVKIGCAFTAYGTEEEYLYEYERWDLVNGWSSDHLLPTDPGRWSNKEMTKWGQTFEELQKDLGKGWEVEENWRITGRPGSGMAWEFAVGFRFPSWFDKQNPAVRVRRRVWRRIVVNMRYRSHRDKSTSEKKTNDAKCGN